MKSNIPLQNRFDSFSTVNFKERHVQVLECLRDKKMTAKEVAVEMASRGYTDTDERNVSAPRLTELVDKGVVEVVGKTVCRYTGKTVSVYAVKGE